MERDRLWHAAPWQGGTLVLALALALFVLLGDGQSAAAAAGNCGSGTTFTVTTGSDGTQPGTLRWAITCSNATVLKETISLPTALLIQPTSLLPTITQPV